MNVLIICTWFPPDSAIAAVRPYMFAKYLSQKGHQVCVLRSGNFINIPDKSYGDYKKAIEVYSYIKNQSDVDLFESGLYRKKVKHETNHMKKQIRKVLPHSYEFLVSAKITVNSIVERIEHNQLIKQAIDQLYEDGKSFDIIFATFGELPNIYGGEYASKKFHAKWIMDFRDTIVRYDQPDWIIWNIYAWFVQRRAVRNADYCTIVSEHSKRRLATNRIQTIYNGFEPDDQLHCFENDTQITNKLVFCYTGNFYEQRKRALEVFLIFLNRMVSEKLIERDSFRFVYAGADSNFVNEIFERNDLKEALDDKGYITRKETEAIQLMSDVFVVLSWNTKRSQGIITGKFYEGIRSGKEILSIIAGNVPNSELWILNNQYNYGFCLEESRKDSYEGFKEYIMRLVTEKKKNEYAIIHRDNEQLKAKFNYSSLTDELVSLAGQLVNIK